MLVGNKVDLVEKDPSLRQVYFDAAHEFAKLHGLIFEEASAVTSHNVKYIFEHLLQERVNVLLMLWIDWVVDCVLDSYGFEGDL
eukprot:g5381.t1